MADANRMRETIEHAVLAALDEHIPALREEIITAVMEAMAGASAPGTTSAALNAALATMHERGTQAEILASMLDGMAQFSGRAALFVVRGAVAQGWQARGLAHNDGIKAFGVDPNGALARRAAESHAPVSGSMEEFDTRMAAGLGAPVPPLAVVLPLIVRNKVAAFIYADAGTEPSGSLDTAAIEILVRAAASWIELSAVRKASGLAQEAPAPVAKAAAASAAPAGAVAGPSVPVIAAPDPAVAEAVEPSAAAAERATPALVVEVTSAKAAPAMTPEDDEVHRKAKRFAKLLVEEIKLYNEPKVAEGRQKRDLYGLLKDDIEKSRASYDKRYGQTVAASADYFTQELIRILANGNESLLGSNFSQ